MNDYVYPSIFFAYFFFLVLLVGAILFFIRSFKDGYWGKHSEDAKYRMLQDEDPHAPVQSGPDRRLS